MNVTVTNAANRRRDVEIFDHVVPSQPTAFETIAAGRQGKHLAPLVWAVREGGCRVAFVFQRSYEFTLSGDQPTILFVGDDTDRALGPAGFPSKPIRRTLETCRRVAIISCGVMTVPYAMAACSAALLQKNTAIIETRPEAEHDWLTLVQSAAPDAQLVICRPRPH